MIGGDSEMMRKHKLRVSNWVHLGPHATNLTPYVRSIFIRTYPLRVNLWKKLWISTTFIQGRKSLKIILSRGWTSDSVKILSSLWSSVEFCCCMCQKGLLLPFTFSYFVFSLSFQIFGYSPILLPPTIAEGLFDLMVHRMLRLEISFNYMWESNRVINQMSSVYGTHMQDPG